MTSVSIGSHEVGEGHSCFVIAEAGVNHNGDLALAQRLVDAAVDAGADAVKFQTFQADRLAAAMAPKAAYQRMRTNGYESQLEMLRRLELSSSAHETLVRHCRARGILFLSSAFDEASADLLERLDVPAFKIPSGELTNLPLLEHLARKGRPLIVSTGMATLEEVEQAVRAIRRAGAVPPLVLLHCVSSYPAPADHANLRAMDTLAGSFGCPVGYSDHTEGLEVALAAAARGACVIEKHLTLDRSLPGPDHHASSTPDEFPRLVHSIRVVEGALGDGRKAPAACERPIADVARKSLVTARDVPAGARLTAEAIAIKRPGTGLPPARLADVIGRVAARMIPADTLLSEEMLR